MSTTRVGEALNRALHDALAADPDLYLLGEDIADPYGGAFKITKGLSTTFPDRVLTTPISEQAIVGAACGLALSGAKAIVELMFADFMALAFDQILNLAAKSVSMYGRITPMPVTIRCPSGGSRGYGPTHSQSLQKHFLGVPGLDVYELSPVHDVRALLARVLAGGRPSMLFEDKVLYPRPLCTGGVVDELLRYELIGAGDGTARVYIDGMVDRDVVLICPGGVADRAMAALRAELLEHDVVVELLVPARLYPLDVDALLPSVRQAGRVAVAEESTAGGTWGAEVAQALCARAWDRLNAPIRLVHSADSVIPAAPRLERGVIVGEAAIRQGVREVLRD